MRDWTPVRDRYLKDPLPTRLGGIAANLARTASFSSNEGHFTAVADLLTETRHFIEWAAPDTDLATQDALVQLQVELARWGIRISHGWEDRATRQALADHAQRWSRAMLDRSGLLAPR